MSKKTPDEFDDNGIPIFARNNKGEPICGYTRPNPRNHAWAKRGCQSTKRTQNGRCARAGHGGKPLKGKDNPAYKDGKYSREELTREYIINRLANTKIKAEGTQDAVLLDVLFDKLSEAIESGDFQALRYVTDQLAGTAASRLEMKIESPELMAAIGRVCVRSPHVSNAEGFMEDLRSELEQSR